MNIDFTDKELIVIDQLSKRLDLSPERIIKRSLAVYQMVQHRIDSGETMHFSGDHLRSPVGLGEVD